MNISRQIILRPSVLHGVFNLAIVAWLLPQALNAAGPATSLDYAISPQVINSGGNQWSSASYSAEASVGEIGDASSSLDAVIYGGFQFEVPNNDATLSALTVSSGTLDPSFDPLTVSYSVRVSSAISIFTVTLTTTDANAAITVNGTTVSSGTASDAISLNVGYNTITNVVTAQDGSTTTTYTMVIVREGDASVLQGWRQTYFGIVTNSGNAADTFDYDHDGIPNLLEWALNLDPTAASKLPATITRAGASFEYTYNRSVEALNAGAVFTVEWSDTLGNDWQVTGVTENILSDNGIEQVVQTSIPIGSGSHRFVRLKVTAPP